MSDFVIALILGVVEGLTEFLPISSTGHLILVGHFINFTGAKADTFEFFIQLGAILAVVVLYFRRFLYLFDFGSPPLSSPAGFTGWPGLTKIFLGILPALIAGAALHHTIKSHLFNPPAVSIALILGGIIIILVERRKSAPGTYDLESITPRQALLIGIFQCAALWPGISRSGSTIVGGLLLGLERPVAAEFSFLLAVPVMVAATLFDLWKSRELLVTDDILLFGVGFLVSFLSALIAIRFFVAFLQRYSLRPFGYYRVILGIAVLALISNL